MDNEKKPTGKVGADSGEARESEPLEPDDARLEATAGAAGEGRAAADGAACENETITGADGLASLPVRGDADAAAAPPSDRRNLADAGETPHSRDDNDGADDPSGRSHLSKQPAGDGAAAVGEGDIADSHSGDDQGERGVRAGDESEPVTDSNRLQRCGMTRRQVVGGAVGIAALLAVGGATKAFAYDGDFLRPPGGQDYDAFLGACIRCDRCRSACPRGAISVCLVNDGLLNARLPKMDFRQGACDMCDGAYKCVAACPTLALGSFDSERDKIGIAVIDQDECLTYNLSGLCDARCVDACAWGALSLDADGQLQVDESRCNGCGACEYVCPSAAYGFYSGSGRRGINVEVLKEGEGRG